MKWIAAVACLGIASTIVLVADEVAPRRSPELAFNLPTKGSMLLSSYRGKVVALEFILTTCPHCQAAARVMTGLQDRYGKQGFQALDIALDPDADLKVENFAKEHTARFPVGWASLDQMMAFMGFNAHPTVPQLVLIDRKGVIRFQTPRLGDSESMKQQVLEQRISALLQAR